MDEPVEALAEYQIAEFERFVQTSPAFCDQDGTELVNWFKWRVSKLVDSDLRALHGLLAHEQEPGVPFVAKWDDVANVENAPRTRLGVSFARLEHAGIARRLGRDRKGRTVWQMLRSSPSERAA